MLDLLAKQNAHLETIENLLKTDRLMQLAQTYGIHQIDVDEDKVVKSLASIDKDDDRIVKAVESIAVIASQLSVENIQSNTLAIESNVVSSKIIKAIETSSTFAQTAAKAHLESLKKMREDIAKNNNYKDIAEKSGQKSATTNIFDKFRNTVQNVREWGQRTKESLSNSEGKMSVGSVLKTPLKSIGAALSPKYAEQLDYIKNERNLNPDSDKTDKELKANYKENNRYQQRNDRNEKNLERNRGTLTKEEYLKGGSDKAKAYEKEQLAIGRGIKKTDTRYRLDDEPEKDEKAQYKAWERALGSRKADKTLEKNFATRATLNERNVANEATLATAVGKTNLTQEEFLSGNSKEAKAYKKEQDAVGKGLQKVDSRYTLGQNEPSRAKPTKAAESNNVLGTVAALGSSIEPMTAANLSQEDKLESIEVTKEYQDSQIKNNEEQTEIFTDQLKTQKEILEILKTPGTAAPASDGGGIGLPKTGGILQKVGGFLIKAGNVASKFMGAAAVPLAVGVVGAAAANLAANTFSDSFGEGGFDVVKKLQDDKVIDYNATVMGFNPSEVLDWEGIQKLKPEDLKKLLDSGVEFSPEDTYKLHKIYTQNLITNGKDSPAAKPEQVTPTAQPAKPEQVTPTAEAPKAEQVTPTAEAPKAANAVYNQSAETVQSASPTIAPVVNNISSPTNVVNNSSSKSPMRIDVKNPESSVQAMFSSRQKFY